MTTPIYTATLAGFLIILQVVLQFSVGMYRTSTMKGTGVGDDEVLERLVRRHGNLAENSGLFVAAIALLELLVGQTETVVYICAAYAVARILHAVGFSNHTGSHLVDRQGIGLLFITSRASGATLNAIIGIVTGVALLRAAL